MLTFMMNRKKVIAENIKRLRRAKGWNQKELAEKGGVSPQYVSQLESGKAKEFGIDAEKKWSEVLGVNWTEFYYIPNDFNHLTKQEFAALPDDQKEMIRGLIKSLASKIKKGEEYIERQSVAPEKGAATKRKK